jgi:anti-sigma factor RsiW
MTCRDVQALAGSYLDGELPEEMCDRVQRHVLRCAGCREDLESVRMAVEVLTAGQAAPEVSEEFVQSALAALARELDITPGAPRSPGQLVLGIGPGSFPGER